LESNQAQLPSTAQLPDQAAGGEQVQRVVYRRLGHPCAIAPQRLGNLLGRQVLRLGQQDRRDL
jgi:hypothetical protein